MDIQKNPRNQSLERYYFSQILIQKGEDSKKNNAPLVGVELHRLICEIFSGETKPFNPHCFLYAIWNHAGHLAGYHQQDAHEFLMATLNSFGNDVCIT